MGKTACTYSFLG